jgi:ferredoxin
MTSSSLSTSRFVHIDKPQLQAIIDDLRSRGYRTIGPRVADAAIVYDDLVSIDQIPLGYIDRQDGGTYRIEKSADGAWFDYVVGPHSLKNYIFPPRDIVLELQRANGSWQVHEPNRDERPLAVIGARSCDLHALAIQDRVFLGNQYVDSAYQARRESLFVVAVNCRRAAATCFCHSMNTGPACTFGFDLALTELDDRFMVEIASQRGDEVIAAAESTPCSQPEVDEARRLPLLLKQKMEARSKGPSAAAPGEPAGRFLDTTGIRDLLMNNLEHPRWSQVAERCLACANCTMVCPTCFCSSVEEVTDLGGDLVSRERSWASCFTAEHSKMSSGTVRKSTASRYRQWLTHKLATWIDQFDTSGCVGCGRCITWCPVGIDLTEEVAAIRETSI